jgi:hypothetical protein
MKFDTLKERHAKRNPEDFIIDYGDYLFMIIRLVFFMYECFENHVRSVLFAQMNNFQVRKMKKLLLAMRTVRSQMTVWSHMLLIHKN